jgi:hypothetical protein
MRKMNRYLLLADGVAVVHAAYVAFVAFGFALIAAGLAMHWEWVRAFWFRVVHPSAIVFVCAESLMGSACPLTTLEGRLLAIGGEASYSRDFAGYWVDRLIYYDFPTWVFMVAYTVFGMSVAIVFILAPPRWPCAAISPHRHTPRAASSESAPCRNRANAKGGQAAPSGSPTRPR